MPETKTSPAMGMPKIHSYEEYDVLSGKEEPRDSYKESTFHTSSQTDGDYKFKQLTDLMESSTEELESDVKLSNTKGDDAEEAENKRVSGSLGTGEKMSKE